MELLQSQYQAILSQIQAVITESQSKINQEKVRMAWRIGKEINAHLPENNQDSYGKNLFQKLEEDTGISRDVLYKMRSFYKFYPKIPNGEKSLNWSHYKTLIGIKDVQKREDLERLVMENSWSQRDLQDEIKRSKIIVIENDRLAVKQVENSKITPARGKLFAYKIKQIPSSSDYFLDCGFGISWRIQEKLPHALRENGLIVSSSKDGQSYSINPLSIPQSRLHTYKAYLNRVVDGDTIRIDLDLGFGIFHHEILRLAKINAPERKTSEGKVSSDALKNILKDVPFLVIKSLKTDIYGRYVADVFLADGSEENPQKVADRGVYLNQLLLDKKFAVTFM